MLDAPSADFGGALSGHATALPCLPELAYKTPAPLRLTRLPFDIGQSGSFARSKRWSKTGMDGGAEVTPFPLRYSRGPIRKATWELKIIVI